MPFVDQRRAPRLACDLPVRIYGRESALDGRSSDISRTGVRLSLAMANLCGAVAADLPSLAASVNRHLGASFALDLDPAVLGSLVRKHVRVARLADPDPAAETLEVGCEFAEPLTTDEARALGLALPAAAAPGALPIRPGYRPQRFVACLTTPRSRIGDRLEGTTRGVHDGAALFITDGRSQLRAGEADLPGVMRSLHEAVGSRPVLQVYRGSRYVWSGEMRIQQVETAGGGSNEVRVHLSVVSPHCPRADE